MKKDCVIELILFLVLGFLLGFVIKTEASKRITMGFADYKIFGAKQDYDFGEIQKKLNEQAQQQKQNQNQEQQQEQVAGDE